MLCNCDLWLCWFTIAVKSQRHTTRRLYSSDRGANGVDKSRFRVGWVWWRSSQRVKCVTSATCMLVMGFRQAVTSHLEKRYFLPKWNTLMCMDMGWFCLIPWSSSNILLSKTRKMANPKPNILDICFFMGRERTRGMTLWWPWSFGDNFSIPLHRLTSSPQNPECNRQLINEGLSV